MPMVGTSRHGVSPRRTFAHPTDGSHDHSCRPGLVRNCARGAGTHNPRTSFGAGASLGSRGLGPPRRMDPGSAPCRAVARHGLPGTTAVVNAGFTAQTAIDIGTFSRGT